MLQPETETTTQTSSESDTASVRYVLGYLKRNLGYFKTCRGVIKIAELLLGILCVFLTSPAYSSGVFFLFVVLVALLGTVILIILYILVGQPILTSVMCSVLAERIFTGVACIDYALASIIQFLDSLQRLDITGIVAGGLGFINTCLYAIATFLVNSAYYDLMYSLS